MLLVFCHLTERLPGNYEKQRYDGWYNNLAHPEWGSVGNYWLVPIIYSSGSLLKLFTHSNYLFILMLWSCFVYKDLNYSFIEIGHWFASLGYGGCKVM